jgi:hypothetical protein
MMRSRAMKRSTATTRGFALLALSALVAAVSGARADWLRTDPKRPRLPTVAIGPFEERIFMLPNAGSPRRGTAEPRALLPLFATRAGPGCRDRWWMIGASAWICSTSAALSDLPSLVAEGVHAPSSDGLPFRYFKVGETGARAFRQLPDVSSGRVAAELEPDFIVGISKIARFEDQDFGLSSKGTWLAIEELLPMRVPTFQGTPVNGDFSQIAWTRRDHTELWVTPLGRRSSTQPRRTLLHVLDTATKNGKQWLRVSDQSWVRADDVQRPPATTPPVDLLPSERWIDVDLASQTLTAYQGEQPVFTTLVSTGKGPKDSPLSTPPGQYRIWVKLRTTDMTNLEEEEAQRYYAIQDVPWVMYFEAGYGLHGAFWHASFGEVRSHGCVNLAPRDAERLFYWASPRVPAGWSAVLPTTHDLGTRVVIH